MGYSNDNSWKLDKWDKIGIASLIVFFTIFVVLNTFSFGAKNVSLIRIDGLGLSGNTLKSTANRTGVYFSVVEGATYTISNNATGQPVLCFLNEIPSEGVQIIPGVVRLNGSYTFVAKSSYNYIYVQGDIDSFNISVTQDSTSMKISLLKLSSSLSFSDLWGVFRNCIPYVLVVVLVSFGIYLISHAIREISKGRDL